MKPLALALLTVCVLAAQPETVIRSNTRLVEVRVVATDRAGEIIPDLRKEEFEILDNGKPQPIAFFSANLLSTSDNPAASQAVASGLPTEYTVVLLDWLNALPADRLRANDALRKVLKSFRPQQEVALYVLGLEPPNTPHPLRMISGFADAAEIANLLEDPLILPNPEMGEMPGIFDARYGPNQRSVSAEQQLYDWNTRIQDTLHALSDLAARMAPLPGRKSMIWLTTGFPDVIDGSVVPGVRKAEVVYLNDMERALSPFIRSDIAVHTIDSRGLSIDTRSYPRTLSAFSEKTGGIFFAARNDLDVGMQAALADIDKGYVLGFLAPEGAAPGMHRIEVRTRRARINLRFRTNYEVAK